MISERGHEGGVTLTEMMLAALSMAIIAGLAKTSIDIYNNIARQNALLQATQQVQIVMQEMARNIRNAHKIVSVAPDKIVIRSYNVKKFGYADTNLFSDVNIGTTTYQYKTGPNSTYIERSITHDGNPPTLSKLLINAVKPPSGSYKIFFDTSNDVDQNLRRMIELEIQLAPAFAKMNKRQPVFKLQAMRRTADDQI